MLSSPSMLIGSLLFRLHTYVEWAWARDLRIDKAKHFADLVSSRSGGAGSQLYNAIGGTALDLAVEIQPARSGKVLHNSRDLGIASE